MTIDDCKRIDAERDAEVRRRDAKERRAAFRVLAAVDSDVLGKALTDICEKPIVRLGHGDYERRIYR